MKTKVYWRPGCSKCEKTKELMRSLNYDFEAVNVDEADAETMEGLRKLGHMGLPIVVTADDDWSGHKPEKIYALV